MHKAVLITPPESEPITLAEAKAHLNVTSSTKDTYITGLITTARRQVERYLHRALIDQTWELYLDCWKSCIKIPYPTLIEVESVKYYDLDGVEQTLSTDLYWVVTADDPGYIQRAYSVTYPELQYGRPDSVKIRYRAGYVTGAEQTPNVPDEIKHAIKLTLTNYYEQRGDIVVSRDIPTRIPSYITDLIHTYKIYNF